MCTLCFGVRDNRCLKLRRGYRTALNYANSNKAGLHNAKAVSERSFQFLSLVGHFLKKKPI